jgi:hypothetical protein
MQDLMMGSQPPDWLQKQMKDIATKQMEMQRQLNNITIFGMPIPIGNMNGIISGGMSGPSCPSTGSALFILQTMRIHMFRL